jgi:Chaperone of endosialidase
MLRAFAGTSALALALICAATMARAGSTLNVNPNAGGGSGTLNVKPNAGAGSGTLNVNPNAGGGSGTLNVKGAGSGAAPASAPSGPYATSPYSASSSRQLMWVRPPPDYRANAAGLGVSQATLDILIAQVKARILADPNYISEPPNVNLDVPTEFPPYWYNGGAPPSGDQLEADANYLVERALGTGLNSPGTRPAARLSEVLKQLSDPQDPPGWTIDNPNYKPPVASEQASSGDSESDSTAKNPGEEPTRTADPNAGKVVANKEPGNPSGGNNEPPGSGDQPDLLESAGKTITGIRDAGVLNAATTLLTCINGRNPMGKCLDEAKTSGKIGVVCQAASALADFLISSSGQGLSLLCGSAGGYQACIRAGGKADECMRSTQGGIPPALFCTAIATLIPGVNLAARAVPALCSTVAPAGWEALVAWLDALGKEAANDYLQPIQDAVLACKYDEALTLALQLEKQREQWAAMAPLSGAQGYFATLFPTLPTLITRLEGEAQQQRQVIGFITDANDTNDPVLRQQFLNDALAAAGNTCMRGWVPPYWPPKQAAGGGAPPPKTVSNNGGSSPPPPTKSTSTTSNNANCPCNPTATNMLCNYTDGGQTPVIPVPSDPATLAYYNGYQSPMTAVGWGTCTSGIVFHGYCPRTNPKNIAYSLVSNSAVVTCVANKSAAAAAPAAPTCMPNCIYSDGTQESAWVYGGPEATVMSIPAGAVPMGGNGYCSPYWCRSTCPLCGRHTGVYTNPNGQCDPGDRRITLVGGQCPGGQASPPTAATPIAATAPPPSAALEPLASTPIPPLVAPNAGMSAISTQPASSTAAPPVPAPCTTPKASTASATTPATPPPSATVSAPVPLASTPIPLVPQPAIRLRSTAPSSGTSSTTGPPAPCAPKASTASATTSAAPPPSAAVSAPVPLASTPIAPLAAPNPGTPSIVSTQPAIRLRSSGPPAPCAAPLPSAAVSAPVPLASTPISPLVAPNPGTPSIANTQPAIGLRSTAPTNSGTSSTAGPMGHPCNSGTSSGTQNGVQGTASRSQTTTSRSSTNGQLVTGRREPTYNPRQPLTSGQQQASVSRSQTTTPRSPSSFNRGGGGFGGGGFGGGGGRHFSDIRLKEDIAPLGRLDNGIGVYRFRYRGNDHTTYVGVMAQEVQTIVPNAVSRGRGGYLRVDYDKLGLEFLTWDEWVARGTTQSRTMQ